jgi:hypothetical protein
VTDISFSVRVQLTLTQDLVHTISAEWKRRLFFAGAVAVELELSLFHVVVLLFVVI